MEAHVVEIQGGIGVIFAQAPQLPRHWREAREAVHTRPGSEARRIEMLGSGDFSSPLSLALALNELRFNCDGGLRIPNA